MYRYDKAANRRTMIEVFGESHAIEAMDAEFWTNEMHDATLGRIQDALLISGARGHDLSWPICGDTLRAIKAKNNDR